VAVFLRKPQLLNVGFPWISLDSLVRNEPYQWVTRDFRWRIFLGASWLVKPPELAPALDATAEGQDCSWGKLNLFSIFPQYIVARAMSIRLPNTKHLAPTPRHRFFERAIGASQGEGDIQ
jgi:hypothetical protein